jgi:Ras-related protein Rab-35
LARFSDLRCKFDILAGQERFRTITSTYYRGTHGVIIVYDITSAESFRSVKKWTEEIERNCDAIPTILVGNKLDREESRVVQRNDGQFYADAKGIAFFETSAMNGENVDLASPYFKTVIIYYI